MVTDDRLVHPKKVLLIIMVIESGILIERRSEQYAKAVDPMLVTESEMATERRLMHLVNALLAIEVTVSGMETETST